MLTLQAEKYIHGKGPAALLQASLCPHLKQLCISYLHIKMNDRSIVYHIPALLNESIDGLNIKKDGVYVDATFGGGGHSRAIMSHLGKNGHLYGFDQDMDAYSNRIEDDRFTFVHSNFAYLTNFLRYYGVTAVDGIIADLGVSFHHFDDAERGFSEIL